MKLLVSLARKSALSRGDDARIRAKSRRPVLFPQGCPDSCPGPSDVARYLRRVKKKTLAALSLLLLGVVSQTVSCHPNRIRIATYNIREFGKARTDLDRLTTIIAKTDADVLAVQEIMNERDLRDVARRLSQGRRSFDVALSRCGGKSKMHVGFLYDKEKLTLLSTTEYPELDPEGGGNCNGERPGFAGTFEDKEKRRKVTLLVVHFLYGGEKERFEMRKAQWRKAHAIAAKIEKENPVAILGDTNSTGWDDDDFSERTFIKEEAKKNHRIVVSDNLGCSNYWTPRAKDGEEEPADGANTLDGQLVPSTLDHIVASPSIVRGRSEVHSFCRELRCKKTSTKPEDFEKVTDHCPVTFDIPNRL